MRDPKKGRGERTEFKDVARQWAEVYVTRLRHETHDRQNGLKPRRSLEEAADAYLAQRRNTKAFNTTKTNATAVAHLLEAFGKTRDLHSISDDELQAWFDDRASTYAQSTLALLRTTMRAFLGWSGRPVAKKIEIPEAHEEDVDALTDDEIEAVQKACETDLERRMVALAIGTGARKAELWALEWEDFKVDGISVRFSRQMAWPGTGTKGLKGKRNRTALVLPGFLDEVPRATGRVLAERPPSTDQAGEMVTELLKRAGLYKPGRGAHVFRHSYGRIGMEKYEWSIEMLRIFLGHKKYTTTQVYAHFGEEAAVRLARERTYRKA